MKQYKALRLLNKLLINGGTAFNKYEKKINKDFIATIISIMENDEKQRENLTINLKNILIKISSDKLITLFKIFPNKSLNSKMNEAISDELNFKINNPISDELFRRLNEPREKNEPIKSLLTDMKAFSRAIFNSDFKIGYGWEFYNVKLNELLLKNILSQIDSDRLIKVFELCEKRIIKLLNELRENTLSLQTLWTAIFNPSFSYDFWVYEVTALEMLLKAILLHIVQVSENNEKDCFNRLSNNMREKSKNYEKFFAKALKILNLSKIPYLYETLAFIVKENQLIIQKLCSNKSEETAKKLIETTTQEYEKIFEIILKNGTNRLRHNLDYISQIIDPVKKQKIIQDLTSMYKAYDTGLNTAKQEKASLFTHINNLPNYSLLLFDKNRSTIPLELNKEENKNIINI